MTKMLNLSIYNITDYYATNRSIYEVSDNGDAEVRESPAGKEVTGNYYKFLFLLKIMPLDFTNLEYMVHINCGIFRNINGIISSFYRQTWRPD